MTKQRLLIKELIEESDRHMNAQQIFGMAKEKMPTIAMATVYNNLNALVENGNIKRIRAGSKTELYDRRLCPHDHLICDSCGCIQDFEVEGLEGYIDSTYGVKINTYELNVYYTCEECEGKLQ